MIPKRTLQLLTVIREDVAAVLRAAVSPEVPPQTCQGSYHVLHTANLRLQTATDRDREIMHAAASDAAAQRWLGWPATSLIPESQRSRLLAAQPGRGGQSRSKGSDQMLLAVDPSSGLAAGGVILNTDSLEAGGWLAPEFRGRGLGAELFVAIAQLGHDHLGIRVVRAGTETANGACVAALLAAGFKPAQGPQTHQLSDGRVIAARWFRHDTEQPARCQK